MTLVLLVDDEVGLREELADILRFEDFDVLEASNGEKAVKLARKHLPDIILCDIMLPDMDGHEILDVMQSSQDTAVIPFIFITARSSKDDIREGMLRGANDYLTKPFRKQILLDTIYAQLRKHGKTVDYYNQQLSGLRQMIAQNIPHEFRTPLTGVMGYSSIIMEAADEMPVEQIKDLAYGIYRAGLRIHRMMENYLLLINLESLTPEKIETWRKFRTDRPSTVISGVIRRKEKDTKRHVIQKLYSSEVEVCLAQEFVEKITDELLDNAIKFSPEDKAVIIETDVTDACFHLRVMDEGIGMTPEQIKGIGVFRQFERDKREQQGLGLGLTLSKSLVELHNGNLKVQSEVEKGTTVEVTLPIQVR